MNRKDNSKKSIFKLIADILTWTIFAILMIVAAFLIYYVIANAVYSKKGERFKPIVSLYTIISGSMLPTIKVYDVVVNLRVDDPSKLHEGDVITFISQSKINYGDTITHRINKITYDNGTYYFTTKGDNNLVPDDSPVEFNNIIGKVILKIPQLGQAQFFLLKQGSKLFLILIPSFGILIYDLLKMLNLVDTKKKVDRSLEVKENKLSKEEEEKLKEEIKNRLSDKNIPDNSETKSVVEKINTTTETKYIEELNTAEKVDENKIEIAEKQAKNQEEKVEDEIVVPKTVSKESLQAVESNKGENTEASNSSKTKSKANNNTSKNKQSNNKTNRNHNYYNKNKHQTNKYKKNNHNSNKNNYKKAENKNANKLDIDVDKVLTKIKNKDY
ncbi:type I signal peptidase [Mycoplasma sp. CAG:956]|nr:type I signal peptidase [Mycoplasma sp. CAG:956]